MINRLVLENLKHRPLRTFLSALSIGFQVMLILSITGLSRGMLADSQRRARGVAADIWIKPPGSSLISFSSATMPEALVSEYFLKQPHVKYATGAVVQASGGINTVVGIDYDEFSKLSGGFKFLAGGPFKSDHDLIVDEFYADQNKKKVGDIVTIVNIPWRISGIVEPGKLARLMVPMKTLQRGTGSSGRLSQIFLKLDDPANTPSVIAALKDTLEDYSIYSIEEFASLFTEKNVPYLKPFITVVISLAIAVGFLVVSLTMYAAVLERTREIGILKALGASPANILSLLVRETVMLALVGWFFGVALSLAVNWVFNTYGRAYLQSELTPDWWPIVAGVALAGALLGATYPGLRAARQDAIEALAYE